MANRHVQTVLGIHWPRRYASYRAEAHHVLLDDGDQIVLHEDQPNAGGAAQPNVLLIHGLAGSHKSTYLRRMTERLVKQNYRVFRMDLRGCGAGQGLAKLPTHCGRSADVVTALHHIAERYPDSNTSIVAYSMGGTIVMNMLAEAGEMRIGNLERSFVIGPPIELTHVEHYFRTFWGRPYDKFFVRLLWKQITRRWQLFPETAPSVIPPRPKHLRDIDELVVAPSGGFDSAEDYYQQTSPGPKLASIKQPLTIFFSEDDPIVPVEPLFTYPRSPSVQVITTPRGGHMGCLARSNDDPDFRWLDWRILDWLEHTSAEAENGSDEGASHREHIGAALDTQPSCR
ncbi:MAG: alpha/beta fold hydrolase [Pirellulales bacterium]|nr:alpha/beta fold hydrolase [Pirellulales bacterium]